MGIEDRLNYELAWRKIKFDFKDRCFVTFPYMEDLIESDLDNWIDRIRNKIRNNEYHPKITEIIDIPKANWHIRPANVLEIEDMLIYAALILEHIDIYREKLKWSAKTIRYSNVLKENQDGPEWFEYRIRLWNKFRIDSLNLIDNECNYVLFADLSAFYENINLRTLLYDLEAIGIPSDTIRLLSKCLNNWAHPRGRGIPQGFSVSDILSDIYLNSIDKMLDYQGITHKRWVDDMRIFCENHEDAIQSLQILTRLLRGKGLNLQTAKTWIKQGDEARNKIDGVAEIIKNIQNETCRELADNYNISSPSMNSFILEEIVKLKKDDTDAITIKSAFENYFLNTDENKFDKTLFHYILNRLRILNDDAAIDYCIDTISKHPEETSFILDRYFSYFPKYFDYIAQKFCELLKKNLVLYEYQKFLIIRWFCKYRNKNEYYTN